jgi:hypothetical protein
MLTEGMVGDAHISLEGGTTVLGLATVDAAAQEETSVLRRNTLEPRQHFFIVPLESETLLAIWRGIGGTIARDVLHIQIEKNGQLVFGDYDRFHPECVKFGPAFPTVLIDLLIENRVLERFRRDLDQPN